MSTLLTFRTGTGVSSYVVHVSNDDRFPQTISTTTGTSWYVTTGATCWIDTISYESGYSGARAKCSLVGNDWSLTSDKYVGTSTDRNITVYASGTTSYTTNPIYFRTGTGVSSYTMQYANSTSTGLTDSITGRDSSTTIYVRSSTNASLISLSYESGYGAPFQFVEYTNSTFSTVQKYFTEGDAYVYSSGTRYIKLFATKQISYVTVSYYKNGGTWSSGSDPYQDVVESGSYSGTATPSGLVSRTNYRLLGWSASSSATSATYSTNEAIGPLGSNLSLYAVWSENPYITLDAGEGRFGTDQYAYFHIEYGGVVDFSKYTPTRSGYTLLGWSANSDATSPTYGPTDYVGPLYGSSYKFYAVWQKSTVTITLNGNGGLWDDATGIIQLTKDVGDVLNFGSYAAITKSGYTHLGWSANSAATSATYGVNGTVDVGASDATYYAVWQKNTIGLFYWDTASTDASLIASGQPISNLTAARWNRLKAKIAELATAEGGSYNYSEVAKGDTIYATEFNAVRTAIMNRSGYGTLPSAQSSGNAVKAALFEGSGSLKTALNAAITNYNNS